MACGVLVVSACSSSAPATSAGGSGTSGSSSTAKGTPIALGMMVPVKSSTGVSVPDSEPAAQAAIDEINAAGGVNGHPLVLKFCDDQDDVQVASQCANTLVNQDKVVAMVGGGGRQDNAIYPLLDSGKIPWICDDAATSDDITNAESYPCGAGNTVFGDLPLLLEPSWNKLALLRSTSTVGVALSTLVQGVASVHHLSLAQVVIDFTATDFQPYVAGITSSRADAWTGAFTVTFVPAMLSTEASLGIKTPALVPSALLNPALMTEQKKTGIVVRSPLQFDTVDSSPALSQVKADFAKYANNLQDFSDNTLGSWLGVKIFAQYASKATDITSAGFQAWLGQQSSLVTGLTAPLDFSQPGPDAAQPRIVNVYAKPAEVKDGVVMILVNKWESSIPGAAPVS